MAKMALQTAGSTGGIWDTSIWRLECSNRSKIRSAQKCNLCLRNDLSPMSPGRTDKKWSREWELNPRPADYESAALPLSYLGKPL